MKKTDLLADLELMKLAAKAAGDVAAAYFRAGNQTSAKVSFKAGDSPVSEADIAANTVLERQLRLTRPDYGWVSEETADDGSRQTAERLFIVDPIDGTRAFIAGKADWCVSVGLVSNGVPVAGIIHLPVHGITYWAAAKQGAFRNGLSIRAARKLRLDNARISGPKPMIDLIEAGAGVTLERAPRVPSLAYRLVMAADGALDLALASSGSHDWDITAADAILRESGAVLVDGLGQALTYNRTSLKRDAMISGPGELVNQATRFLEQLP
jgi:myo-inositol-1(or 4)-monophosphatase